jgi:NAD-dependent SIR2 family protein deacetylase
MSVIGPGDIHILIRNISEYASNGRVYVVTTSVMNEYHEVGFTKKNIIELNGNIKSFRCQKNQHFHFFDDGDHENNKESESDNDSGGDDDDDDDDHNHNHNHLKYNTPYLNQDTSIKRNSDTNDNGDDIEILIDKFNVINSIVSKNNDMCDYGNMEEISVVVEEIKTTKNTSTNNSLCLKNYRNIKSFIHRNFQMACLVSPQISPRCRKCNSRILPYVGEFTERKSDGVCGITHRALQRTMKLLDKLGSDDSIFFINVDLSNTRNKIILEHCKRKHIKIIEITENSCNSTDEKILCIDNNVLDSLTYIMRVLSSTCKKQQNGTSMFFT